MSAPDPATTRSDEPGAACVGGPVDARPLVDWARTARRMGIVAAVLVTLVVVGWLVDGIVGDTGFRLRVLGELGGLALLATFVAEVVVVGGASVRGMLRAGDRGERLAGSDVSLLPPQLRGCRRR